MYRGMRVGGVRGQLCCPLPLSHFPLMLPWITRRDCRMMIVTGDESERDLRGGSHTRRNEVREHTSCSWEDLQTKLLLCEWSLLHSTPQSCLTIAAMLQCPLQARRPGCRSSHHCTVGVRKRRRRRIELLPFLPSLQTKNKSESCHTVVNYRRELVPFFVQFQHYLTSSWSWSVFPSHTPSKVCVAWEEAGRFQCPTYLAFP